MEAIIASVLGGLVGGLFTFLGVWMTIHHENKKTRQEELKRQKEKEEQARIVAEAKAKLAKSENKKK